jgi:hypothetical protein
MATELTSVVGTGGAPVIHNDSTAATATATPTLAPPPAEPPTNGNANGSIGEHQVAFHFEGGVTSSPTSATIVAAPSPAAGGGHGSGVGEDDFLARFRNEPASDDTKLTVKPSATVGGRRVSRLHTHALKI